MAEDNPPWTHHSSSRLATRAVEVHASGSIADRRADDASDLLKRLFCGFDGSLAMRLWKGTNLRLGAPDAGGAEPRFTLVCRHLSVVRSMALGRDPLRLE